MSDIVIPSLFNPFSHGIPRGEGEQILPPPRKKIWKYGVEKLANLKSQKSFETIGSSKPIIISVSEG